MGGLFYYPTSSTLTLVPVKKICALIVLVMLVISCNSRVEESSEKQLIKAYYASLNNFELGSIPGYYYDSIRMVENDYLYLASKDSFYIKLQWDSVFRPRYEILEIEEIENDLIVEVSKSDPRILFLNEEPSVYRERFSFKEGLIFSSETKDFVIFNWDLWDKNRSKLVNWIKENHPELDGFLYDQTRQGGINYLRAIALYKGAHQE